MTQQLFYGGTFALSALLLILYIFQWRKSFDVHMTVAFILIPILNLAYWILYSSPDPSTASAAMKLIYVGACFLPWITAMCVMSLCGIRVSRPIRIATLFLNAVIFGFVLTIGYFPFFYRSLSTEEAGGALVLKKEYGPVHTVYYAVIILYLIADLVAIAYSYLKKKQVSRRVLFLLFLPIPLTMAAYFANHFFSASGYEIIPVSYVLALAVYLFIVRRMVLYNVSETVIESAVQSGDTAFITFDSHRRYLGSNETAKEILPDLRSLTVDRPVGDIPSLRETVTAWIDRFEKGPDAGRIIYVTDGDGDEKIYTVTVGYLRDDKKSYGYQIFMEDDTQNQKYIRLLDRYNSDLQADVEAKTERIVEMHDRLILGMAAMVESRDNSTGGHIRRTSVGVRYLIEAMKEDGSLPFSEEFCRNIIKAAPMHDLGKIAVDDAILRKAGPFTPEEREKMKKHAEEGAKIVRRILKDTDDADFRRIAENVAHYHHERVDGSGYPDGLRGDEIPPEARIMAIADVYDALVSRRVYKEKFSFEEADRIIKEGMGTQFDEALLPYYEAARPRLEEFYAKESADADN